MYLDQAVPQALFDIPSGDAGTRATLRAMRALVRRYRTDSRVRQTATELVAAVPQKSWTSEVSAIFAYVRDGIRYIRDTRGVETVHSPVATMERGQGDCDDKSVLLAALLESIGHPTRFVAVGFDPLGPFSHVYVETRIGPRWVALDPTMDWPVGRAPSGVARRMICHV